MILLTCDACQKTVTVKRVTSLGRIKADGWFIVGGDGSECVVACCASHVIAAQTLKPKEETTSHDPEFAPAVAAAG